MKFRSATVFTFSVFVALVAACASKSTQTNSKTANPNSMTTEPLPSVKTSAGSPLPSPSEIDGKAFSIDGASVTARAVISNGDCRRPVFIDANRVAFASRRASLDRWQVFEADFAKQVERRISFDAGDAEPVVTFGRRLVIASSSDERKSGERLLNKYRGVFAPGQDAPLAASPVPIEIPLQHLLLEHPANGRKGTEWVRISNAAALSWSIGVDKDFKHALALQHSPSGVQAFRVAMSGGGHGRVSEPEARGWSQIKIEAPVSTVTTGLKTPVAVVDGQLMPDGKNIVWSNGSILWTTNLNGADALRVGDDSIPAANDLTIDPSGQWIVFSSPTPTRGKNLMAVHKSGRCLRTLTELPGDEIEPAFSPDGTKLLFALRQGDSTVVSEISFGSPATIAAACP